MSELKLEPLEWTSPDTFYNHSCVGRLPLERRFLVLCIRTRILIVGPINVHRLALIQSTDFALGFVFVFCITLQFLHDPAHKA